MSKKSLGMTDQEFQQAVLKLILLKNGLKSSRKHQTRKLNTSYITARGD